MFGEMTHVRPRNRVLGVVEILTGRGNYWWLSGTRKSIRSLCCGVRSKGIIQFSIMAQHALRPLIKILWTLVIVNIIIIITTIIAISSSESSSTPLLNILLLSRTTQPPNLCRTGNEYRPKCNDALRLGNKGRMAQSFCSWTNAWVVDKTVWSIINTCHSERFRGELALGVSSHGKAL